MTALSIPTSDTLDQSLFGVIPHLDVLSRLVLLQGCNGRFPIAHTKSRAHRSGSTRKLYKQKGTGNARAGSSRSPTRRGGGVAFGPRSNANFHLTMNAGERRLGLASALTLKAQDNKIRVLESLSPKTSAMMKVIAPLIAEGSVLFVTTTAEKLKNKGIQNIAHTHTDVVTHLSPAEILKYDFCVFTKDALETLSSHFSS